ncbi:metal ABC transporter permease [Candidatus Flexifilum breve]|uniref:metal ABC transporter permease n=1 Tax=Candidatus Flexifilum breve TaxID=3140694 RepID=UPI0031CCD090
MFALAIGIAVLSGIVGLYASYYADVSSGAAIVLTATALFAAAWIVHSLRRSRQIEADEEEMETVYE